MEVTHAMGKRSSHQERIIKNYYRNYDSIMVQRLGELVTDLYLAEGKARAKLWERIAAALKNLEIPEQRIDHLLKSDNPTLVANLVQELQQRQ